MSKFDANRPSLFTFYEFELLCLCFEMIDSFLESKMERSETAKSVGFEWDFAIGHMGISENRGPQCST